jgi:hypothetical protein
MRSKQVETGQSGNSQLEAILAFALLFTRAIAAARESGFLFGRIMFVAQHTSPDDGVDVFGFLRIPEVVCR